jgi:uncharacterized integral membrane protein (TIGR00698 family)
MSLTPITRSVSSDERPWLGGIGPGILLVAAIAATAVLLQRSFGVVALSPLIISIAIGILVRNTVGLPAAAVPGIKFALRRVLRFAIILLGLQLTVADVGAIGGAGLLAIVATMVATFLFTKWVARYVGVDCKLAELIAAGTSICGASAVIATNTVTRARDEDVAYAVACVTVFGSISVILFPILANAMQLSAETYGLWTGATIHEVAQVVAAAFQGGEAAGQAGTVAKLTRVILLAPLILTLGLFAARRSGGRSEAAAPVPWFVFGFLALVAVNSLVTIPPEAHAAIVTTTAFLLSMALAAMGLETDIGKLRAKGWRPLALGAIATVFISAFGLAAILALGL